jgi:hypothetical protein
MKLNKELLTKKNLVIGGASLAAVLLLAGYFFVLPGMQVSSYKNVVKTKHAQLKDDVDEISAVLDSEAFVSTDVDAATTTAEVKKANEAIKDTEHTLSLVEDDLTSFNVLPLQWNSKYKDAKELKQSEKQYVAETRAYIKDLKEVVAFLDKSNELSKGIANFQEEVALADQSSETWPEYGEMLEPSVNKVEKFLNDMAKLKVPASLKELADYNLKASHELLDLYKQEVVAAKADDEEKVWDLTDQEDAKMIEMGTKIEELNAKFISDSSLRKTTDRLNDLNRTIESEINKL